MMLGVRNVGSVQLCISPASYGIGWPQGLLGGPKWPPHAHADSADDWLGVSRLCGPYMTLFMWMLRHLHSLVAGFQEGAFRRDENRHFRSLKAWPRE